MKNQTHKQDLSDFSTDLEVVIKESEVFTEKQIKDAINYVTNCYKDTSNYRFLLNKEGYYGTELKHVEDDPNVLIIDVCYFTKDKRITPPPRETAPHKKSRLKSVCFSYSAGTMKTVALLTNEDGGFAV